MSASEAPIDCTPVILTLNEEANLGRALESVSWATDVVVLDSGSKDRTRSIAREYSNVRWFERAFDDFGSQWSFAVTETGIKSTYVLALDADMAVTPDLARELSEVASRRHVSGAVIPFDYRIDGVSLR
ncbi:MAG: glycosyltransferase, partial [Thermoanaerobaculia bacterium]|nr:glycosyltransferase [Thermoanaerobaculia bacterium]